MYRTAVTGSQDTRNLGKTTAITVRQTEYWASAASHICWLGIHLPTAFNIWIILTFYHPQTIQIKGFLLSTQAPWGLAQHRRRQLALWAVSFLARELQTELLPHEASDLIDNSHFKVANTDVHWVIFPPINLWFCSLRCFIASMQTFSNLGTPVTFEIYLCNRLLSRNVYNCIRSINAVLNELSCTGL